MTSFCIIDFFFIFCCQVFRLVWQLMNISISLSVCLSLFLHQSNYLLSLSLSNAYHYVCSSVPFKQCLSHISLSPFVSFLFTLSLSLSLSLSLFTFLFALYFRLSFASLPFFLLSFISFCSSFFLSRVSSLFLPFISLSILVR
jgi:hypothetical protein